MTNDSMLGWTFTKYIRWSAIILPNNISSEMIDYLSKMGLNSKM